MSRDLPAPRQVTAAKVVLRVLATLPPGITEGLWRHADICHLSRRGTCRQVAWLVKEHLLPALAVHAAWRPSWDAEAAVLTVLSLRRLPVVLSTLEG